MDINTSLGGTMPSLNAGDRSPIHAPESVAKSTEGFDLNATKDSIMQSVQSIDQLRKLEVQGEKIPVSEEQLIKAIERAIKAVQGPLTSLEFSVHEKTRQIVVKVKDKDTGEIIREIPPEKNLDLIAKIWEMAGILIDERR
jgi:flagellar protein FlaG